MRLVLNRFRMLSKGVQNGKVRSESFITPAFRDHE